MSDSIGRRARRVGIVAGIGLAAGCTGDTPAPAGPANPSEVASVSVDRASLGLFTGVATQLTASVQFASGSSHRGLTTSLEWSSDDPGVATVDNRGRVQAVGEGVTSITAAFGDLSASIPVVVNPTIETTSVRMSQGDPSFSQEEPHMVMGPDGTLYAGWKSGNGAVWERVSFASSRDRGLTWSDAKLMAFHAPVGPESFQSDPWLAVDSQGRIYYVRLEYPGDFDFDAGTSLIVVSWSDDGGMTWGHTVNLSEGPGLADKPSIAVAPDDAIYVTYNDIFFDRSFNEVVTFRSDDRGETWSELAILDAVSFSPLLAFDASGAVYLAFWDRPFMAVHRSDDRGRTWTPRSMVTPDPSVASDFTLPRAAAPRFPATTVDRDGTVYLIWPDSGFPMRPDLDVIVSRSTDRGVTWAGGVRVNDVADGHQWLPTMAAGPDGVLHAAWFDGRTGNTNLVYARSADGGLTWSRNLRLSTEESPGVGRRVGDYLTMVAENGGVAHVAWTGFPWGLSRPAEIFFVTVDGG